MIVAILYLERLNQDISLPLLTSRTLQRLLLVSVMLASKYLEDTNRRNTRW